MTTFRSISIVEESSNSAQTRKFGDFGFCSDIFPYFEIIILCDNLEPKNSKAFSICHLKAGTWERQGQFAVLCLLGLPQDWQGDLCQMDSHYLLRRAAAPPVKSPNIVSKRSSDQIGGNLFWWSLVFPGQMGSAVNLVRWKGRLKGHRLLPYVAIRFCDRCLQHLGQNTIS